VPRIDLRVDSENRLRQIGLAYQQAVILGPVTGPEALGKGIRLKDPRGRPYEVVWRVDPARLGGEGSLLLAWEQAPDEENGRCVLRVDGSTAHVSEDEFRQAAKARPNQ
jgi:hypothetical protein